MNPALGHRLHRWGSPLNPRDADRSGGTSGPRLARRRWSIAVLVTAGALIFATTIHQHHPIDGWIFFRYLRATLLATLFCGACVMAGHAVVVRAIRRVLPIGEHLTVAFAVGVFVFFLASFVCGLLGLYGRPFFLLGPGALIAFGARDTLRTAARLRRRLARVDLRLSIDPLRGAILALGCLGLLELWLTILTPQNASYDARWYHLPIAEHYVAEGGIAPFREGWVVGALPQLASLLDAWAFSAPGDLFDRVETAAHMEFAIFLMTLVGVAATVRKILGERAPLSWVALFLFPGIFCYDSGLVLGADHVAALWAAPIFLLSLRYTERPSKGYALLLGVVIAGALDTKYTAAILIPLPLAMLVARAARPTTSKRPRGIVAASLLTASVVVLTAPHWLKNALFYGDPMFPLWRHWFQAHPWSDAAEAPYEIWFALRRPPWSWLGVVEMAKTLVTFSFVPHDFPQYHGERPIFGSLFTLLTPLLVFFGGRRLYWLFGGVYLGIAAWFWIHEFDRYLQAIVPWMAAATAVVIILVWREGGVARLALVLLVGFQVVWGGDVPFIPAHRASASAILQTVLQLLGRGDPKESGDRLVSYPEWEAMSRVLPRGAKVLVHEEEIHLGLSVASALDYPGNQGAFYWGEPDASTPAAVWKLLRAHGISHLVWATNLDHGTDTVAGAFVFFDFALHHAKPVGTYGGFALAVLPDAPPAPTVPGKVAYYPCDVDPLFAPGLYPLEALTRGPNDRRPVAPSIPTASMDEAIAQSQFLLYDARCRGPLSSDARTQFELLAARGHSMMLKRRAAP
jgi:hypothetical protein